MKTLKLITAVYLGISALLLSSCDELGVGCIRGNGNITTEGRVVSDFSGVEVNGSFVVYVDSSNETSVLVEADENLLDEIRTQVRGNNLVIDTHRDRCLNSRHDIIIYVTTPDIDELIMRGSGRINCSRFETNNLNVDVSGSGRIYMDYFKTQDSNLGISGSGTVTGTIDAYSSDLRVDGSGKIMIDGNAHIVNLNITGSGNIRADEFYSDICNVTITGSGDAYVYATDLLDARITGSGNVFYYGNPADVVKQITGSGNIVKR